jgi:hypothetical protein
MREIDASGLAQLDAEYETPELMSDKLRFIISVATPGKQLLHDTTAIGFAGAIVLLAG